MKSRKRTRSVQTTPETFSSSIVAGIAKISLRQLQWWDERGVARPCSRVGHIRQYSRRDLRDVILVAALRRKGLSLQRIRRLIPRIEREAKALIGEGFILTDGRSLYIERNADGVAKRLVDHPSPLAVVTLPA